MTPHSPERLHRPWLSNASALGLAALLALSAAGLGIGFVEFERHEIQAQHAAQVEQYVRLLEQQTSNTLSNVEATIRSVGERIENAAGTPDRKTLDAILLDNLRGRPAIRSLMLLSDTGEVIASSSGQHGNQHLDLAAMGAMPGAHPQTVLGRPLIGKELASLRSSDPGLETLNAIPMARRLLPPRGEAATLVALVNADHLGSLYEQLLTDFSMHVGVFDAQAHLLAASGNVRLEFGGSAKSLPAFSDNSHGYAVGQYAGTGMNGDEVIGSYRASSTWPFVLVVEQSATVAAAELQTLQVRTLAVVLTLWLAAALIVAGAARNTRRNMAISDQLSFADQSIADIEARNNAVLESSLDGILTFDWNWCVIAFNTSAEHMFGRSRADVMGRPMDELIGHDPLPGEPQDDIKGYFQSGRGPELNRRIETRGKRADGSTFPIELAFVPLHMNGEILFTATMRDISEQRALEAERTALLGQYRTLTTDLKRQKIALDEHAIVSIEDANEVIIYANEKLLEISGYSREELLGRHHFHFRKHLDRPVYDGLRESLQQGKVWHGDLVKRRRDGGTYWVSNTTVPVYDDDGAVREYITIQTDISALKRAQEALADARSREMEIGHRIQQSLLTASPSDSPTRHLPDFWVSCFSQASKGVDGDFVEMMDLGDHCLDIIVGDVMGKGVPAALMGAATKLQFSRAIAELSLAGDRLAEPPQPSAILSAVHRAMTPHLQALDAFVTLAYIRVDSLRNVVTWVGCGHEETLIVRKNGSTILLENQHPPLGVLDSDVYTQQEVAFDEGDSMFLCSDGAADATWVSGGNLGRDLINDTVKGLLAAHPTPSAVVHLLRSELFNENVLLNDDLTMVLVKRPSERRGQQRCELPLRMTSIGALRAFVTEQAEGAGFDEAAIALLEVASVEVFTNIVRHARGLLPGAPLELVAKRTLQEFTLDFVHLGEPFTPPAKPAVTDFAAFPEGGFGMTIIRGASDRLEYLHHDGVCTVRMARFRAAL